MGKLFHAIQFSLLIIICIFVVIYTENEMVKNISYVIGSISVILLLVDMMMIDKSSYYRS